MLPASGPRVFVSHSHQDEDFTQRLVADLRTAGAVVWVDVADIRHGDFMRRIDEALDQSEWLVLVLTPAALASSYVRSEVDAALHLVHQGRMRDVIPILAAPTLPNTIPPLWGVLQRYDATRDDQAAVTGVCHALGLRAPWEQPGTPAPEVAPASRPALPLLPMIPPERFPSRLADLDFLGTNMRGVQVILPPLCDVSTGAFLMGSNPKQDQEADVYEKPQHNVTLAAYRLARFPVTVAEYACFVRAGHSEPKRREYSGQVVDWATQLQRLDHPVVCVSWHGAIAYAAWLSKATHKPWRLPSEAEWEKAACWDPTTRRARIYPWGDTFDPSRANTYESGRDTTTPVGTYPTGASPCGAQDMAGNVWEWTSSLFMTYPYDASDGRERVDAPENRVLRGGRWGFTAWYARAAYRSRLAPDYVYVGIGFRLLCGVPGS
jgi:formylglycine-generating enzyme required for sulfatase activity